MSRTTRSGWTRKKPTVGWWWVQWPKDPWLGPEVLEVTQPNGPDTDYLEVGGVPIDEYIAEWTPEWQPVPAPRK